MIQVKNLSKEFKLSKKKRKEMGDEFKNVKIFKAVDNVSFECSPGKIFGLIGPNGAGKTTLFAMVAGFLKADEGRIDFKNASVLGMKPHQICQLGMVRTFQNNSTICRFKRPCKNIMVGAYSNTSDTDIARTKAEEVAEVVGMTSLLNQGADGLTVAGRKTS